MRYRIARRWRPLAASLLAGLALVAGIKSFTAEAQGTPSITASVLPGAVTIRPLMDPVEMEFVYNLNGAAAPTNYYLDCELSATVKVLHPTAPEEKTLPETVYGFAYDKATNKWRMRVAPAEGEIYQPSTWTVEWKFTRPGFADITGTLIFQSQDYLNRRTFVYRGNIYHSTTDFFYYDGNIPKRFVPLGLDFCTYDVSGNGDISTGDDYDSDGDCTQTQGDCASQPLGVEKFASADVFFQRMGGAFNTARVGFGHCGEDIKTSIGSGALEINDARAAQFDEVFKKAKANDLKLWLTFMDDAIFPGAGELADAGKKNALKKYIQYIIARYGAYVDFYELMNEFPSGSETLDPNWYAEIVPFVEARNKFYNHPLTTSILSTSTAATYPQLNFSTAHLYANEAELNSDTTMAGWIATEQASFPDRPLVVSEQGNQSQNWDLGSKTRARIRAWTAALGRKVGVLFWNTSMRKNFIGNPSNIYLGPEERGQMAVLKDVLDNTILAGDSVQTIPDTNYHTYFTISNTSNVRAFATRSTNYFRPQTLAYLHHYTSHSSAVSTQVTFYFQSQAVVYWIDPATGAPADETPITGGGPTTVTSPSFTTDLAMLVIPRGSYPSNSTVGIYRPSDSYFYLRNSVSAGPADIFAWYGEPTDTHLAGDWDNDGDDTIGVFRNGSFLLKNTNTGGSADVIINFGQAGDKGLTGDFDGDGRMDVGVYRPSDGYFWLRLDTVDGPQVVWIAGMGLPGDKPFAIDWDGNGVSEVGLYRPSTGRWYIRPYIYNWAANTTTDISFVWGGTDDLPIVGDWDGNGRQDIGLFTTTNRTWTLRYSFRGGPVVKAFLYGDVGDLPVVGDWNGIPD